MIAAQGGNVVVVRLCGAFYNSANPAQELLHPAPKKASINHSIATILCILEHLDRHCTNWVGFPSHR